MTASPRSSARVEQRGRSRPWRRRRRRPSGPRGSAASAADLEPAARPRPSAGCRRTGVSIGSVGSFGPQAEPARRQLGGAAAASAAGDDASRARAGRWRAGLRNRFSRTLRRHRPGSRPCGRRRPGRCPARIAARGEARPSGSPSSTTLPPSMRRSPNSARPTCLLAGAAQADQADHLAGAQRRSRPGRPRRSAGRATASARGPGAASALARRPARVGRPTIRRHQLLGAWSRRPACVADQTRRRAARPPRSAMSNTSSSRCET